MLCSGSEAMDLVESGKFRRSMAQALRPAPSRADPEIFSASERLA